MTTYEQAIREVREEWTIETGEDPGDGGASVILDHLCEAFFQKFHGAGVEYAVASDRGIARYLAAGPWKGTPDGDLLAIRLEQTR